ncbi:NAD(P)/FAD-dependent oxidoreductase [Arsenicibacter rosenii]|uniref:Pyridine nucleotide-disulfide oxidoreductase n=1 Tax=Arsenicibacter rosenii TaxID=1750698 RepID=A0A1S2VRB9_9BACT|nr:NAD(P)/FAD-dependent oxidoreductase [Arsenicibacter rosenii]OIN60338.1 pyridine nucleotide-disulfide oxidoreductase [Arsenicibacter rosenii]
MKEPYDAAIIGGSFAGLSAALVLGRSMRHAVVIDAGKPCNRQTPASHNFLTHDGRPPGEILAEARRNVQRYPTVDLVAGTVITAAQTTGGFTLTTQAGEQLTARKLLLATGVADQMPPIPGFAECWGRSVLHCPFCHGYEVRNEPIGLLANGEMAHELARLIEQWSPNLTLFTNGPSTLTADQLADVRQLGIPVIEDEVQAILHQDGFMQAVQLADNRTVALTALFSRVPFTHHTDLADQLGCAYSETGHIAVDGMGQTNVAGVFAAGDCTTVMRQVAMAVAAGSKAGVAVNRVLRQDELARRKEVGS